MCKTKLSLMLLVSTLLFTLVTLLEPSKETVEARIVTVQRGDVHQVVALTGRVGYSDENILCAPVNAVVDRILVEPGRRIGAGEALVRFSAGMEAQIAAVYSQYGDVIGAYASDDWQQWIASKEDPVLRAEADCTVRQVLVHENTPVAAGTPLIRTSSGYQEIICTAARTEAAKIDSGMWAWISSEGEPLGFAEVAMSGGLHADPVTGLSSAEIVLTPATYLQLPEGACVDAEIYLAGSDDVMTLPVEAITSRDTVWWVHHGRCTEIPAEIVMSDEILAWVMLPEGISVAVGEFTEGQRVVEEAS